MIHDKITDRILTHAKYYVDNSSTVREVAKHFGLSKSQVHINLSVDLKKINKSLYEEVREIMERNKRERHIRGGAAIKRKYELMKSTD